MRDFKYKCTVAKNGTKMYYQKVGGKWKRISNNLGKNVEKGKRKYMMDNSFRDALIPHAGEKPAGDARKSAFEQFSNKENVDYIIYIGTIHKPINSNKVYILNNDTNETIPNSEIVPYNEHSFEWVEKELRRNFKNDLKN